jgi:hypothetical protein
LLHARHSPSSGCPCLYKSTLQSVHLQEPESVNLWALPGSLDALRVLMGTAVPAQVQCCPLPYSVAVTLTPVSDTECASSVDLTLASFSCDFNAVSHGARFVHACRVLIKLQRSRSCSMMLFGVLPSIIHDVACAHSGSRQRSACRLTSMCQAATSYDGCARRCRRMYIQANQHVLQF